MYMGVSHNWGNHFGGPNNNYKDQSIFRVYIGVPYFGKVPYIYIYICVCVYIYIYLRKKMILVLRVQVPTCVALGMSGVESNCGLGFVEERMNVEYSEGLYSMRST